MKIFLVILFSYGICAGILSIYIQIDNELERRRHKRKKEVNKYAHYNRHKTIR